MRVSHLIIAALAGYGFATAVLPAVVQSLPRTWTHRVTETCTLRARTWALRLGADPSVPSTAHRTPAQQRCLYRRGQKSASPFLKTVLRTWPSPAELAAVRQSESEDVASSFPLPARQGHALDLPARGRR